MYYNLLINDDEKLPLFDWYLIAQTKTDSLDDDRDDDSDMLDLFSES